MGDNATLFCTHSSRLNLNLKSVGKRTLQVASLSWSLWLITCNKIQPMITLFAHIWMKTAKLSEKLFKLGMQDLLWFYMFSVVCEWLWFLPVLEHSFPRHQMGLFWFHWILGCFCAEYDFVDLHNKTSFDPTWPAINFQSHSRMGVKRKFSVYCRGFESAYAYMSYEGYALQCPLLVVGVSERLYPISDWRAWFSTWCSWTCVLLWSTLSLK